MEVMHERCAGIDIGKKSATVCIRVQGRGKKTASEVIDCGSMTREILALRDRLVADEVTCVVMEATSDYWKPYYFVLEDLIGAGVEVILANAAHVKNVPGRKTDVNDAMWLAELGAHGLVRASFVPPPPIRALRDLTRTRGLIVHERTREIARLEKRLESPGIKLSVVVSHLDGVSARRMLDALVAGERDPHVLADLAVPQMWRKHDDLVDALTGRFTDHDAFMIGLHLRRIDELDAQIAVLDERIEEAMAPFRLKRDLLCTIPGVSEVTATAIIAETGGDMSVFPTADHLAAWSGVAPGQYQSAGRKKNVKARPGDCYLKGALGIAAMSVARSHGMHYLAVRYRRIKGRRGFNRAIVATERFMLVAIWHMLTDNVPYQDLGGDHYDKSHADRARRNAIRQLKNLGYDVELKQAS